MRTSLSTGIILLQQYSQKAHGAFLCLAPEIRVIGPYDCSVLPFQCREHTVSSIVHFNSDAFELGKICSRRRCGLAGVALRFTLQL